jgi:hypothetical protein
MAIDWNVIKADYLLHHELSLTALAEKYGVEYPSLNSVASREHWAEERANRGAEIQRKALAAAEINQVEELAAFDNVCLQQAKAILGTVGIVLTEYRKPHELKALASAAESAQRMGRLCLGAAIETTQQIPAEFNVDAARDWLYNAMPEAEEKKDPPLQ